MNSPDILDRGHQAVLRALNGLPRSEWDTPGVCGVWSVRDILAHLAAYEHLMQEAIAAAAAGGGAPGPHADRYAKSYLAFNDEEVEARRGRTADAVLAEYTDTQAQVAALVRQMPAETLRMPGTMPWYGDDNSVEDLIARIGMGHKREHAAQIAVFRDRPKA